MNYNFRRGGLFLLPAVIIAIAFAVIMSAPVQALVSIGGFGFVTAIALIFLGDRRKTKEIDELEM